MPAVNLSWDKIKKLTGAVRKASAPSASDHQYSIPTLWVDTSTNYVYVIVDSTPGAAVWYQVSAGLISGIYTGSGVFNGSTGVSVAIGSTLSSANYKLAITPLANPINVGPIYTSTKTTSTFKVFNLGSDAVTQFDWVLIDTSVAGISVYAGNDTFAGSGGTTSVSIGTTLTGTSYYVALTPTANPSLVGGFYMTNKSTTGFDVKNSGSGVSAFDWVLFDKN
jgi:hypothetical protein